MLAPTLLDHTRSCLQLVIVDVDGCVAVVGALGGNVCGFVTFCVPPCAGVRRHVLVMLVVHLGAQRWPQLSWMMFVRVCVWSLLV